MFRFRLQRLLDLREAHERTKATEMARAEADYETAQAALAELEAVRQHGRERLSAVASGQGTVGEIRNLVFVLEQMDMKVAGAASTMYAAEQAAEKARQELRDAHKDRRVLDRLREKHEADWRDAEASADRQAMDAIALTRHAQRTTNDTASATPGSLRPVETSERSSHR